MEDVHGPITFGKHTDQRMVTLLTAAKLDSAAKWNLSGIFQFYFLELLIKHEPLISIRHRSAGLRRRGAPGNREKTNKV